MALMMLMLHTMQNMMQMTNQAILTCLDTINSANKLQHGHLRAAINAKADSTKIARLDRRLTKLADNVRDNIAATFGAKIQSTLDAILDLRANLQHLTKKINDSDIPGDAWQLTIIHQQRR
jgi:hypothetical protein